MAAALAMGGGAALATHGDPNVFHCPEESFGCTVSGSEGDDQVVGSPGPDTLYGLGGGDMVLGLGSDDALNGGAGVDALMGDVGNDTLKGGTGIDTLLGDAGNDKLFGEEDSDTLEGGAGEDIMNGGDRFDVMHGNEDRDIMQGGPGNYTDKLNGDSGNDDLYGGDGNDVISGDPDSDVISGGKGDDVIGRETYGPDGPKIIGTEQDGAVDEIDCGPGRDRLVAHDKDLDRVSNCELLKITRLELNDPRWRVRRDVYTIIGYDRLRFLSTDNHPYHGGNTRIYGTIIIEGHRDDTLESLELEVRRGGTVARARVAPRARNILFRRFGADGQVSIEDPMLLFNLPSAQANLLDDDRNGDVRLKVVAESTNEDEQAERDFGRQVPRLVRYDGANRYGGRDAGAGGDDWVKPSVRPVARHFGGINWGDFSNMNGGHFPPHASHQTGNDLDGWYEGYNRRNAATARQMIRYLNNDRYGNRIQVVWVTYQRRNTDAFWRAIRNVELDDGRMARDVIQPAGGHTTHFHWRVSD